MGAVTASRARSTRTVDAVRFLNWSIGDGLRRKREARGLTQAALARMAGMRPEVLCRIESGKGNPTVRTIQRILQAMGYRA